MEDYIKRVNLSFDLRRKRDKKVYDLVSSKSHKTDYVINVILSHENIQNTKDKEFIKEALKEVLEEINFNGNIINTEENHDIPENIFDLFENM